MPLPKAALFELPPPALTQVERVRLRLVGFRRDTARIGMRVRVIGLSADRTRRDLGTDGTVTNVDDRFVDVDWREGGWTRFEWSKPGVRQIEVIE